MFSSLLSQESSSINSQQQHSDDDDDDDDDDSSSNSSGSRSSGRSVGGRRRARRKRRTASSSSQSQSQSQRPGGVVTQQSQTRQHAHQVDITRDEVIRRIEQLVFALIDDLDADIVPTLQTYNDNDNDNNNSDDEDDDSCITKSNSNGSDDDDDNDSAAARQQQQQQNQNNKSIITKRFTLQQCRSYTSILLVLSYCHALLLSRRTTTTREVYYYFVTHFRSQRECDAAIADACLILKIPRHTLGLKASPRGWFCGDVQLVSKPIPLPIPTPGSSTIGQQQQPQQPPVVVLLDGRTTTQQSLTGYPISSDWLLSLQQRPFTLSTNTARCILVVEKEGIYNRLVEDKLHQKHPCILITGKGFPDLATRAMVYALYRELRLPVYGLADCDPHGIMVLHTYMYSERLGVDGGGRYSVPIQWLGLRPSQVEYLKKSNSNGSSSGSSGSSGGGGSNNNSAASAGTTLPDAVFLKLDELDKRRLQNHLLNDQHRWTNNSSQSATLNERRVEELEDMLENGYKVELEALHWLGMDYCCDYVQQILDYNYNNRLQQQQQQQQQHQQQNNINNNNVGSGSGSPGSTTTSSTAADSDEDDEDNNNNNNSKGNKEWIEII